MKNAVLILAAAVELFAQAPPRAANTDEHIRTVEARLKQTPLDSALRSELAGAFLQKMRETADGGYLERASKIIDQILKTEPSHFEARRRRIEIEMQRHHFHQVVPLAESLLTERPVDSATWGLLGDALMELGEYDRAADVYQKMADIRAGFASYNRVAFYRFVTGDAEGAIDAMRMAIRAGSPEPENVAWCLSDLGQMLLKTGQPDQAEQAYQQALVLFPGYHHALAGLARVEISRGHYDPAIELLLKAQSKAPFSEYAGLLAKLYRKRKQREVADRQIALLDVADKLDNAAGERANRNLALAFADLGYHTSRALELAQAELEVRGDVYTYDTLAWTFFRNGRIQDAVEAMSKALAQGTPEPAFHVHAAAIFEAAGRAEDARHHREQLPNLNPSVAEF